MKRGILLVVLSLVVLGSAPSSRAASGHLEGYIPAAANGEGRFGSFWTTDVWIYHQGASVIHLWFNPAGQDNTAGQSYVINLDESAVQITDIVGSLFGTDGVGSVHYLADGPVSIVSRTWTAAPGGGSYGQTIPGVPLTMASIAGTGQGGTLRVLADQKTGSRANLGIANVSPVNLTATVEIFLADGQAAPGNSTFDVELAPFDMTQINDVLSRLPAGEREGLIVRVGITSAEGAVVAYLSEVDNTTNDASYQEGFRFSF